MFILLLGATAALLQYTPGAFVIKRQVGQLGFATETEWEYTGGVRNPLDPSQPKRTVEASGVSVRLFDARLDDGRRVLLKEFLGDARAIAANELAMYELLYKRSTDAGRPPPQQIGTLLGRMVADQTFGSAAFVADWSAALPAVPPPATDGLWLVFAWESLRTAQGFVRAPQQRGWLDLDGRAALRERMRFVKRACARMLQTVGWLHGQGVVHRSLGGASLLLSTYDQASRDVSVAAIDLGFAATSASLTADEVAAAMARGATSPVDVLPFLTQADDLHALAYVILELALGASASAGGDEGAPAGGGAPQADLQSLKRLVEDVFGGDVAGGFREYCAAEPGWAPAVALLDEGGVDGRAGWQLVQAMVDCRDAAKLARDVSAAALLESEWFEV